MIMKTNYIFRKSKFMLLCCLLMFNVTMAQLPVERLTFSPVSSGWDTTSKEIYTYTSSGKVAEMLSLSYAGNQTFRDSARTTYTYNAGGNMTSNLRETWDDNTNSWVSNTNRLYDFDSNQNLTFNVYLQWSNSLSQWDTTYAYNYNYTYNGDGKISEKISTRYSNGIWENRNKEVYEWNPNGEYDNVTKYAWNGTGWEYDTRTIDIEWYDFSPMKYNKYVFQIWSGSAWEDRGRWSYSWNADGQLEQMLLEEWNGTEWVNDWQWTQDYDMNGNRVLYEVHEWNGTGWDFDHGARTAFTYDADNNIETETLESNSGGGWVFRVKYHYKYTSPTFVSENHTKPNLNIYPNPVSTLCYIETSLSDAEVNILNITGQKMKADNKIVISDGVILIDFAEFIPGTYIIQLISGDQYLVKKIIKY